MARRRNPQLPALPAGIIPDAEYLAQDSALRAKQSQDYSDILRDLGWEDDSGGFIPGRIESEANAQRTDLERQRHLAIEDVTNAMGNQGTVFSGYRGTAQARSEEPMVHAMADLDVKVPQQLGDLTEQADQTITDYVIGRNQLLADLAARRAAGAGASGVADPIEVPKGGWQGVDIPFGNPARRATQGIAHRHGLRLLRRGR